MATQTVRKNNAGRRTKKPGEKVDVRMFGMMIDLIDLRLGDVIINRFANPDTLEASFGGTKDVREITLCEGQWRTHVHVNKIMCYDSRQQVCIVDPSRSE